MGMNILNTLKRLFVRNKPLPKAPGTPEMYVVQIFAGQQCFALDIKTGEVEVITLRRLEGSKYLLTPQPNKMYEIAVNKRNAVRKLTARLKVINQGGVSKS